MTIKDFVEDSIADNQVIIFSKTWCRYSKLVKKLFSEKFPDVKPRIIELDEREDGESIQQYLLEKTGQRTVPNVFVNKKHIGGNDATQGSFESGQLAKDLAA